MTKKEKVIWQAWETCTEPVVFRAKIYGTDLVVNEDHDIIFGANQSFFIRESSVNNKKEKKLIENALKDKNKEELFFLILEELTPDQILEIMYRCYCSGAEEVRNNIKNSLHIF